MLYVSSGFKAACKAASREWDCKVFVQWNLPFFSIHEGVTGVNRVRTNNLTEDVSSVADQIINGVCAKIYNQVGLTTTDVSNSSKNFAYPYPNVDISWSSATSVNKVTIVGRDGEYPTLVDIILRNSGTLVLNKVNQVLTSEFSVVDLGGNYTANELIVSIKSWSAANETIKLLQVNPSMVTEFTDNNVISMTIDESIENSGELIIGSVEAKSLNLVLDNSNNDFDPNSASLYGALLNKNVKIMPYLGVKVAGVYEYCPMGVYYSDEWVPSDTMTQMTVTGIDMMSIFEDITFNFSNWVSGSYPAQVGTYLFQLFDVVLAGRGLTVNITGNPPTANKTLTMSSQATTLKNKKCREVLFYLAERLGCFVYFSKNGGLYFKVLSDYSSSYDDSITNDNYFNIKSPQKNKLSANVFSIVSVDNNKFVSADTADVEKRGEIEYSLIGNPLIWNTTEADAVFTTCLNNNPRTLFSPEIEITWQGNPAWEFFDRIAISNLGIEFLVTSNRYEYNGGLRCTTRGRKLI